MNKKPKPKSCFRAGLLVVLIILSTSVQFELVRGNVPSSNSWVSKHDMSQARANAGVGVVGDKIYVIGGQHGDVVSYNEEYNLLADNWTYKSPMPHARSNFATAVYNGKIYCIGGSSSGMALSLNEVYDPSTDTWKSKAPLMTPTINTQANVVDGKIYLIGGSSDRKINQVYDPVNDSWSLKSEIPIGVYDYYVTAAIDNKIFVFSDGLTQIYDTLNDNWSRGAPSPHSTILVAAGATTGIFAPEKVYLFGLDAPQPYLPLTSSGFITQCYDPSNNTWSDCSDASIGRFGSGIAVLNDVLYLVGGVTSSFGSNRFDLNLIYSYSTANEVYVPLSYGSHKQILQVLSPVKNENFTTDSINLNYTTDMPLEWQAYSLDGKEIIAINGNTTIAGITKGQHNLTLYGVDSIGNNVTSEVVNFSVNKSDNSTFAIFGTGLGATLVCGGLLLFFKKRHFSLKI